MTIKETLFNIFWNYQNLLLFSTFSDCNQPRTQKIIASHIKDDCIYHKYWYEPVHNCSKEPKHIQIDRCTFGLLAMGGCNTECASYTPMNQEDN
jgi:hypothetical protein